MLIALLITAAALLQESPLERFGTPRPPGAYPAVADLSPDGTRVALLDADRRLVLRTSPQDATPVELPLPGTGHILETARFSADGRLLLGALNNPAGGGRIIVWDLSSGERRVFGAGPYEGVQVEPSPDGAWVARVDRQDVGIFDLRTGRPSRTLPLPGLVRFSLDSRSIVSINGDGRVGRWSVPDGVRRLEHGPVLAMLRVLCLDAEPERAVVATRDGRLWIRELSSGDRTPLTDKDARVRSAAFSPDGRLLALVEGASKAVVFRELASGQEVARLDALPAAPQDVVFSREGGTVAVLLIDHTVVRGAWDPMLGDPGDRPILEARVWADLGSTVASEAQRAVVALARAEEALVRAIVDRLRKSPGGEGLREIRAMQALERRGDGSARELLRGLTEPPGPESLAREARRALDRLQRRR